MVQSDPQVELLQVGEVARLTGKTVRAIHLYEQLGLLRPQHRSRGGYRLFSHDALLRVRWIAKLQELGFSLSEIQHLVRDQAGSRSAQFAAARLRALYASKLDETRARLRQLRALEAELEASLEYLNACDSSCLPEIPVGSCARCVCRQPSTPDLVAGAHVQ